jgi:hypothetical protein
MFDEAVMALMFNLYNLELEAAGSDSRFISLLSNHYYKKIPKKQHLIPKLNLYGNSFIVWPEPLFNAPKHFETSLIIQYIKLAGRRDYTLFKEYGVYPDLDYSSLVLNPLLKITRTDILFKFEEQIRKENGISIRQYSRQSD